MAILGYSLVPYDSWDLVRHYEAFEKVKELSFFQVLEYGHIRYLPLHLYMWLLSTVGLSKEFLPFISLFFSYLLSLLVMHDVVRKNIVETNGVYSKITLLAVLVMLTIIPFIGIASSLRQYLAISMLLYVVYYYSKLGNVISIIAFSFIVMVHISTLPVIFIFYLSRLSIFSKLGFYILSISFVFIITGFYSELFFFLTDYFKPYLESKGMYFALYMNPDTIELLNSGDSLNETILKKVISPSVFYIFGIISIFFAKNSDEKSLRSFLVLLMVFISFISIAPDPFSRYTAFYTVIYFIVFFRTDYKKLSKINREILLIIMVACTLVVNIAKANSYKLVLAPSWSKVLYIPIPLILLGQVNQSEYIKVD